MPTDLELCDLIIALYDAPAPSEIDGVVYSVGKVGDYWVINLRGSKTPKDWLRDFIALPAWDKDLGIIHAGMFLGMRSLFTLLMAFIPADAKIIIIGHSLGGARARYLTGLFIMAGRRIELCWTMGSPRPGYANLRRIFEKAKKAGLLGASVSYRGNEDPVPMVPFDPPVLDLFLRWVHPDDFIHLVEPTDDDDLDPLRDHHGARYRLGFLARDAKVLVPTEVKVSGPGLATSA